MSWNFGRHSVEKNWITHVRRITRLYWPKSETVCFLQCLLLEQHMSCRTSCSHHKLRRTTFSNELALALRRATFSVSTTIFNRFANADTHRQLTVCSIFKTKSTTVALRDPSIAQPHTDKYYSGFGYFEAAKPFLWSVLLFKEQLISPLLRCYLVVRQRCQIALNAMPTAVRVSSRSRHLHCHYMPLALCVTSCSLLLWSFDQRLVGTTSLRVVDAEDVFDRACVQYHK